jgi:hypothetical protein
MTGKSGERWRVLAHESTGEVQLENRGVFDELVVDDWLHVEKMDEGAWWLRVGDARLNVRIVNGVTEVDVERGVYSEPRGATFASDQQQR